MKVRAARLLPLALLPALGAAAGPARAGDWPTYRGSPALEGATEERLPARPEQLWRAEAGEAVRSTPIAGGGRIYALTTGGTLLALSPAGRELWRVRLDRGAGEGAAESGFAAPPLYVAGRVVAVSLAGAAHAVDAATGRLRWSTSLGAAVEGSPTYAPASGAAPDSVLVLTQGDGTVRRLALGSGRELGASPPTNRCDGSAAVAGGTVVYGNCDAALHFLSAETLRPLGRLDLERDGQVHAGVAVAGGVVYAGDRSGRLYAVDLGGRRQLWVNRDAKGDLSAAPAVRDGLAVFSSDDGGVYGVDAASGRLRWRSEAGGRPGAPLIDAGGRVAVSARGVLRILDGRDGAELWSREVSDEISDPSLAEGRLLVGTDDGAVVAFGEAGGAGR